MTKTKKPDDEDVWRLATWDGARREALRRWAQLPLERVIAALEEMQELSDALSGTVTSGEEKSQTTLDNGVQEQANDYGAGATIPVKGSNNTD